MRIAITGASGQLGTSLQSGLDGDVVPLNRQDLDITEADQVDAVLGRVQPDLVINAAAYNQVDQAEDEPAAAYAGNALGPRNLAIWCGRADVPLLHVSTDYVFGLDQDRSGPYAETDAAGPLSAYGTSKLAAEYFVRSLCPKHFVVRTCGLYGRRSSGEANNFVETMLRLAGQRSELAVVDDQHCTPTSTKDLAAVIAQLVTTDAYGLYHATNTGSTSWYEFAREIFRLADVTVTIRSITSAEFGAKARRPGYSVLDTTKLASTLALEIPAWQDALARYLAEKPSHSCES